MIKRKNSATQTVSKIGMTQAVSKIETGCSHPTDLV